jgi:hypothetical protein
MTTRKPAHFAHSKLTKTAVDRLHYESDGPQQQILWDTVLTGFGCRVYPTGTRSFVVSYRVKCRWRLMTLGQ